MRVQLPEPGYIFGEGVAGILIGEFERVALFMENEAALVILHHTSYDAGGNPIKCEVPQPLLQAFTFEFTGFRARGGAILEVW